MLSSLSVKQERSKSRSQIPLSKCEMMEKRFLWHKKKKSGKGSGRRRAHTAREKAFDLGSILRSSLQANRDLSSDAKAEPIKESDLFWIFSSFISLIMSLSILLVEDTKTIAESIKKYLERDGHTVLRVEHWDYANEVVKHQNFDIVLLDLMLPWTDGIEIAKTIRKLNPQTPILMMTARGQLEDKLEGFGVGADDYLVKPFDLEELEARIFALTKRIAPKEELFFEDIRIDLSQKKVFKADQELKFSLKEFQILELLMQNQGIAVSRLNIIEEIWGGEAGFEEDGKLDVYVSTIRKKIGKACIETIKGFGYRMNR